MQIRSSIGGKTGVSKEDLRKFLGIRAVKLESEQEGANPPTGMEQRMRQCGKG